MLDVELEWAVGGWVENNFLERKFVGRYDTPQKRRYDATHLLVNN